jgi:hypothetical protein
VRGLWLEFLTRFNLWRSQPTRIRPLEAPVSSLILAFIILLTKKRYGRDRRTPSTSRGSEISQSNPSILRRGVGSLMMIHPSLTERNHRNHPPSLLIPYQLLLLLQTKVQRTVEVLVIHQFPAITLINWDSVE